MKNNKTLLIIILIIAVGLAGFFVGKSINNKKVERFKQMVEFTYPEPPEVINETTGVVTDIRGATIYLEIEDPEDYLPNLNEEEVNKLTKYVSISDQTEIIHIDHSTGSEEAVISQISLSDIEKGYELTVMTDSNIRAEDSFKAEIIEYVTF